MATTKKDKILEWIRWGLAVLVIPLGVWLISLETGNAVQNERISKLTEYKEVDGPVMGGRVETLERNLGVQAEQIKTLREDLKEARAMRTAIQVNTVALGKLEVKIDAVHTNLTEITRILRAP